MLELIDTLLTFSGAAFWIIVFAGASLWSRLYLIDKRVQRKQRRRVNA